MTVVAVTAHRHTDEDERVHLNTSYVTALENAGLVPLVLPTSLQPSHAALALQAVTGLVLSGGEDVDPAMYGARPHPQLGRIDRQRDEVEAALVRAAFDLRIPVFAICRGMQILNVALGGTLYQDLPSECPGPIAHDAGKGEHDVAIAHPSLLSRTVNGGSLRANSRHHQALKDVAPALVVTGRAPDGVVEAVELREPEGRWLIGVQWHPEDITEVGLFRAFAEAALGVEAVG
ncbi:MAG TPA: gamma-glutamyl-gamma-aminobutyrate hydrolase family protein [Gemmatimonadales bacterium]|nr:gamma-glutamyl-gamma-aminobutyrate hydrolase family protein [Gemmatimonadales bacterium]